MQKMFRFLYLKTKSSVQKEIYFVNKHIVFVITAFMVKYNDYFKG